MWLLHLIRDLFHHSHGGQEAHLVADELAKANIGVILTPPRAFPGSWDERRAYVLTCSSRCSN